MLALGTIPPIEESVLGFLSVFFISASALILNDYFDLEIDRINSPNRPLPSGKVSPNDALILFITITLLGFIASTLLGLAELIVSILVWGIGFLYNWKYKRSGLWGNLMVSLSVGMTFIYGAIAVGKPFEKLVWIFSIIAFLIDLGEEIAADALDIEGDKLIDSKSIAILYGQNIALKVSAIIFGSVIVLSIIPFILSWLAKIYFVPLIVMDVIIAISTVRLLQTENTKKAKDIRRIYISSGTVMGILIILRIVL